MNLVRLGDAVLADCWAASASLSRALHCMAFGLGAIRFCLRAIRLISSCSSDSYGFHSPF